MGTRTCSLDEGMEMADDGVESYISGLIGLIAVADRYTRHVSCVSQFDTCS